MIQKGNFLLMHRDEFRSWLQAQKITRRIKGLQVHHTASPNYATRGVKNGVGTQDKFKCLEGMRDFHIKTNKWRATGQNITIFEDGYVAISLDRDLNQDPAGIYNNNKGWVCIENIGFFDKGQDKITDEERKTIVHVYACLAEKLHIAIHTNTVVYHAWYSASGTRLADYTPGKSSKSCPGTDWWGDGNTIAAAKKNFLPQVQAELNRLKGVSAPVTPVTKPVPTPQPTLPEKDDEEMTKEQIEAFDKLVKTVEDQAKVIAELTKNLDSVLKKQSMTVPTWAADAVYKYKNLQYDGEKVVLDTPNGGSQDFYRMLTIVDRIEKAKNKK